MSNGRLSFRSFCSALSSVSVITVSVKPKTKPPKECCSVLSEFRRRTVNRQKPNSGWATCPTGADQTAAALARGTFLLRPTFSNLISTKASLTVAGQRSLRRATHPVKGRKTRNRAPARSDSQSSRGRINNHTHKTRPKIRAAVSAGSPTKPGLKLRNSGTD